MTDNRQNTAQEAVQGSQDGGKQTRAYQLTPEERDLLDTYRRIPQWWQLDARDSLGAMAAAWGAYLDAMGPGYRGRAEWTYTLTGCMTGKNPQEQAMALDILEQEINARLPDGWVFDPGMGCPTPAQDSHCQDPLPTLQDWIQIEMDASSAVYTRLLWVRAGHAENEPIPEGWTGQEEQEGQAE